MNMNMLVCMWIHCILTAYDIDIMPVLFDPTTSNTCPAVVDVIVYRE